MRWVARWSGVCGFVFAASIAFPSGAWGAEPVNITGTWDCCGSSGGAAAQVWRIVDSNGVLSGTAALPTGQVFATISGSVTGHSVRTVQTYNSFDLGYVAHDDGTIAPDGRSMSGSWSSNQHQSGTWVATLVPGTGTAPPSNCIGGCSNFEFQFDPTLDAAQTTLAVSAGCGAGGTAADEAAPLGHVAAPGGCDVIGSLTSGDTSGPVVSTQSMAAGEAEQLSHWSQFQGGQDKIFQAEQAVTQTQATRAAKDLQQWQDYIRDLPPAATSSTAAKLSQADASLAGDFAGSEAAPAADATAAAGLYLGPPAARVLASIYATHPTAADAKAFKQELKLATAPTYSPARAVARLTLIAAALLGERAIAHDLGFRRLSQLRHANPIILDSVHARLHTDQRARLIFTATPLGARILRWLSMIGLTHRTSIKLTLSERTTTRPVTRTVSRAIKVR